MNASAYLSASDMLSICCCTTLLANSSVTTPAAIVFPSLLNKNLPSSRHALNVSSTSGRADVISTTAVA